MQLISLCLPQRLTVNCNTYSISLISLKKKQPTTHHCTHRDRNNCFEVANNSFYWPIFLEYLLNFKREIADRFRFPLVSHNSLAGITIPLHRLHNSEVWTSVTSAVQ